MFHADAIVNDRRTSNEIDISSINLQLSSSKYCSSTLNSSVSPLINSLPLHSSVDHVHDDRCQCVIRPFLKHVNEHRLINSFACSNDSTLGAGEYSFLLYSSQSLILFNVDGQLHRTSWNTQIYDTIKSIRWSSYYHAYLMMTAQTFYLLTMFTYELSRMNITDEPLQLFTCHHTDLWLICLSNATQRQNFRRYELSTCQRDVEVYQLNRLSLEDTDTICALECHPTGEYLSILVAERDQRSTVDIQRRRRLILLTSFDLQPVRTVYFTNGNDIYWTMTYVNNQRNQQTGWLLGKWFDRQLTFVDDHCYSKVTCIQYHKELRNHSMTIDEHYLALRTVNSLDIYRID
jgi:hypothetical protein